MEPLRPVARRDPPPFHISDNSAPQPRRRNSDKKPFRSSVMGSRSSHTRRANGEHQPSQGCTQNDRQVSHTHQGYNQADKSTHRHADQRYHESF